MIIYMTAPEEDEIFEHSDWATYHLESSFEECKNYRDKIHPKWKLYTIEINEINE